MAGAAVVVDPAIRIALNGFDLCPGGADPGGGGCGTTFTVRVGDQLSARAYNSYDDTLLTTGTFDWTLGANADPATATRPVRRVQVHRPGRLDDRHPHLDAPRPEPHLRGRSR